jgi:hypothetical protein
MTKAQRPPKDTGAKLVQLLEYMDGPQAVLLERTADRKIVAVAISKSGMHYPFFGAGISFDQWDRYRRGFLDLRYLFMHPRWKEWFVFELPQESGKSVALERAEKDAFAEQNYVPEAGFFSYDHSEPIDVPHAEGLVTQKYRTDGKWDLPDFGEFYNKITDLYVFFLSLRKFVSDEVSTDEKRKIRQSFVDHPLRGGISYVNLYAGLHSAQQFQDRLVVGRLKYGSPGEVDVKGRPDVFNDMMVAFEKIEEQYDQVRDSYYQIHEYLRKSNLLKRDPEKFDSNDPVGRYIRDRANDFAKELSIENPKLIYDLTDKNALKYIKVLLAHFRRLDRYFLFFEEGRVKVPQIVDQK